MAVFRRIDDAGCRIGGGGEDDEGGPHVVVYWRWLMAARDSFLAWPTLGTCTCDYSPPPFTTPAIVRRGPRSRRA